MDPDRPEASTPPSHADAVAGHSPLALVEWDGEGRVARWTQQAEALFGWREEEVLGKRITDWPFVHPDDVAAVARRTGRLVRGRDRQNLSANRNLTRDGRVLYCEWYNTALLDGEGRLTAQLSLVLDVTARVRAREEAEAARAAAERAADRTRRLQALTEALSEALTPAQVARAVMDQSVAALEADAAVMVLVTPDGHDLELVDSRGFGPERLGGWERFPLAAPVPIAEAARTGELVILRSREERAEKYPMLAGRTTEHAVSISVPLVVEGETIGAMGLNFLAMQEVGDEDRSFLLALARQSAQAIRRSTLYAAERGARREAERLEERLRLALASADIGTWDFHPGSGALAWDARCKAIFGLPADAVVDFAAFLAAAHPDDRGAVEAEIAAALHPAGTGEFGCEYRAAWPDGTVRWAQARGRAFFEGEGAERHAARFVGTILDVTERREAEEERERLLAELELERGRLEVLAEASTALAPSLDFESTVPSVARFAVPRFADGCVVHLTDGDGRVHRLEVANAAPAAEARLRGILAERPGDYASDDHPVGRAIRTRSAQWVAEITEPVLRALAHGEEQVRAMRELAIRSCIVAPLVTDGRLLGTITFLTAVSGRCYAEGDVAFAEELARRAALAVDRARLYEDALAASRAKTGFLATMSHELRTPLNAMIGYAELLFLGIPAPLPDGARSHVERIDRASRHLLSIIEEILTFSRIDAGRETVAAEPVELGELVGEVCAMAEPLAAEKRLRFAPPVLAAPVRLVTDPRKLRQILINLLGNAVKFTEAGEVALSVETDGGTVELRVRDTGIGIAPEDVERIFEPFLQVDQGTTRSVGGTGLGLSVSRELARMIGGEIRVESSPGRGSTFTVRLPAAPGEPA